MGKWKSVEFVAKNDAGTVDKLVVEVNIDATGQFYANVPDRFRRSIGKKFLRHRSRAVKGTITVGADTYAELEREIERAHELLIKPVVKEEPVILYNIESHVSFAMTKDGRIFPNAGYPGAEWPNREAKLYGDHHSTNRAEGGYSLVVGAQAMMKKTITYGENTTVEYERYYGEGGDHAGQDNPAEKLNSWVSFSLPNDPREMPYSDEAAMFFHNLMMSMAELNRRVQDFTSTPETLALAIQRHSGLLLLEGPGQVAKPGERGAKA